jgi:hypothetical protein
VSGLGVVDAAERRVRAPASARLRSRVAEEAAAATATEAAACLRAGQRAHVGDIPRARREGAFPVSKGAEVRVWAIFTE